MSGITIGNILTADDPRLPAVRLIYDEAFPEDGDEGWDWLIQRLAGADNSPGVTPTHYHILVAEEAGRILGFMALAFWSKAVGGDAGLGFGDYLGVLGTRRGGGIGGELYRASLAVLEGDAAEAGVPLAGMAFDVEDPELAVTEENRHLRERRIAFYERLGARLLSEVDFWEPALGAAPALRYRLFYHRSSRDLEPRQLVLALYRLIYGWDYEHPLVKLTLRIDTQS